MWPKKYPTCLSLTDGGSSQHIPSILGILHNPHYRQDFWEDSTALLAISECQNHHYWVLFLPVFPCPTLVTNGMLCEAATHLSSNSWEMANLTGNSCLSLEWSQGKQSTLTLSNSAATQVKMAFVDTTSLAWLRSWKNQTITQARK